MSGEGKCMCSEGEMFWKNGFLWDVYILSVKEEFSDEFDEMCRETEKRLVNRGIVFYNGNN